MACKKYRLSNTGTTVEFFTYRRCDDGQTISQVSLRPGQRRNIWLLDNSYNLAGLPPDPVIVSEIFPITPSNTRTPTPTQTPTQTLTPTRTSTQTPTETPTQTPTSTETPTQTPTQTVTPSITPTNTSTPTQTPSQTATPSITPTQTQTASQTPSQTATPTQTQSPGISPTPTSSITPTITKTVTRTPTQTKTPTPTKSITPTPTPTSFRNVIFENQSTGVTLTSASIGGGTLQVNFSYPLLPGQNGIGQHNGISSLGWFNSTATGLTGNNGWSLELYKNDVIFSSPYSCSLPDTPNSYLVAFSITDVLKIIIKEAPVTC